MGGIMGDMQVGMGVGMGMGMNPPMGMGSPFPPVVGGGMNINMRMNTPSFTSLRPTPSRAMGGQGQMTPYHLNPPPRFQQPQPSPPHFNQPSMTPSFNAADGFMPPQPWGHASPMAMPGGGGMFPMGNIGANPGIAMGMGAMGPFGGGGGNLNMGMNQPGPMTGGPMSMGMNMGAGMPAGGPGSLFAGGAPMGVNPLGMGMGIMDPNSGMGLNMPMNMGMNIPLGMNTMPIALSPNRVPGSAHPRHQPFGGVTGGMQHQQPQQQQQQQHQYRTPNQGPTGTAMRRGGQQGTHMGPGMAMRDETMMTATPMQQTTYPFHMSGHHSHSGGASGSGE
ncbi:uncharacterized protein EI90DRAFT_903950 [Cantharellus anzutake]|uniref:uncharacterized protein n=1 Tax=Cantharellus anzutake TaxID=1750568 RepID=UPI001908C2A7|nr:uncharacterized protein EI90DRAFT_903950 [Cantharellus anzutake]KAF8331939.1 hypothetical protein EI90DRAFT_903950 [Cantharellus anzutake]